MIKINYVNTGATKKRAIARLKIKFKIKNLELINL